jgi:cytochrome P450
MTPVRTLKGPRGHWLLGALPRLRRDMLGFFEECHRDHGDAAYFRVGNRRGMLISHPRDIEQVLVTDNRRFIKNFALQFLRPLLGNGLLLNEGESWLRQRRLIQPAFSRARIESYAPAMVESTQRLLSEWQPGEVRDVALDMNHLTMAISGRTLLGIDVSGRFGELMGLLDFTLRDFLARFGSALPLPGWVPTIRNLRMKATVRKLDYILQQLIDERRASGGGGDFLSLLMAARDEEDGTALSDRQLRDEVMTMFLAGHETTANALSWTLYLLAQHPNCQRRLQDEVRQVLGGAPPTAADVPKLAYCERVLKESMRLYPPAYVIGRRPVEDLSIGEHFVPRHTNVLMSQWVVHRDERWYERPLAFDPDRWTPDYMAELPKYAYFPFGGGPRVCIGNNFALFEATLVLAAIFQRFQLELVSSEPIPVLTAVTLRPARAMEMRIRAD